MQLRTCMHHATQVGSQSECLARSPIPNAAAAAADLRKVASQLAQIHALLVDGRQLEINSHKPVRESSVLVTIKFKRC